MGKSYLKSFLTIPMGNSASEHPMDPMPFITGAAHRFGAGEGPAVTSTLRGTHMKYGGFHSHGATPKWLVYSGTSP